MTFISSKLISVLRCVRRTAGVLTKAPNFTCRHRLYKR